jgi:hypothetical protein
MKTDKNCLRGAGPDRSTMDESGPSHHFAATQQFNRGVARLARSGLVPGDDNGIADMDGAFEQLPFLNGEGRVE